MVTTIALEQLASLPHMLVPILDALQSDADESEIAGLIRQDPIVSSKLLSAAKAASLPADSIEQSLKQLGTNQLRSLLVSYGLRQFFKPANENISKDSQVLLWQNALACAHFARVLATLTSYPSPEEAYQCGLFANLGQSLLLEEFGQAYSQLLEEFPDPATLARQEQQQFNQNHAELAANIIAGWNPPGFAADAILYQHEPLQQIQDAHHLVKIIHCARQAADTRELSDNTLATAQQLFGLNEALTRELYNRNTSDIDKLSENLGLATKGSFEVAQTQLGVRLGEISELTQMNALIQQAYNPVTRLQAISHCLQMNFDILRPVLFQLDDASRQLTATLGPEGNHADFKLPLEPGRSLAADCVLQATALQSEQGTPLSVVDRQLLHYCQGDTLFCYPLLNGGAIAGVLVYAASADRQDQLHQKQQLLSGLCQHIAQILLQDAQDSALRTEDGAFSPASAYQQKIREAVHEASNPLSIIHNYLEMLRIKLGDQHEANESLELIKEEIERVGNILHLLKEEPRQEVLEQPVLDVNRLIEDTAQIIKESICVAKNLTLQLHLDKQMTEIQGDSNHLKQILTNLLKNAGEALEEGGEITISSDSKVSFSGRDCIAICVADNGPGITDKIKENLFYPVSSSKGSQHSGLGLSIVKKLVDEMKGYIVCRSNSQGTEFQILLPVSSN